MVAADHKEGCGQKPVYYNFNRSRLGDGKLVDCGIDHISLCRVLAGSIQLRRDM